MLGCVLQTPKSSTKETMGMTTLLRALAASSLIWTSYTACVPEVPQKLLSDPKLLAHPAVISAFESINQYLDKQFENITNDALSFGVVSMSKTI